MNRSGWTRLHTAPLLIGLWLLAACQITLALEETTATGVVPSADGVPIHYVTAGTGGTALVFVHAWSCDKSYWDRQIDSFAPQYRVVAIDLAGHGESGLDRRDYTVPAFAGDVVAVVESLGLRRIVLIGHSMGGPVIAEAVRRLTGQVVGLVTVDVFKTAIPLPNEEEFRDFIAPIKRDFRRAREKMVRTYFSPQSDAELVEHIARDMASAPPAVGVSAMAETFGWMFKEAPATLASLNVPLRHINADPEVKKSAANGDVVWIAGAGHFIPQEAPEQFNAALAGVLREYERIAPPQ